MIRLGTSKQTHGGEVDARENAFDVGGGETTAQDFSEDATVVGLGVYTAGAGGVEIDILNCFFISTAFGVLSCEARPEFAASGRLQDG